MRKDFVTNFWQQAYEKLPAGSRAQYLTQMKAAERWELAIDDVIEVWSRAKAAVAKLFHTPRTKGA
jgi:hypothetical protein